MDKLYGNKRKILLYIYNHYDEHLTRFNVPEKLKSIPTSDSIMHLKDLVSNGYIQYIGLNDTIKLTSKGLSYFSDETNTNIEICIKSIIFPIIISIFTTLITLWLKG